MKKVIRLNENDIEKLVKKIIKEEDEQQPQQAKEKSLVLLKTNNGELSTMDDIIRAIKSAKDAFEDLVNSKLTGSNGYTKEIDGIVNDFTKLEDKVRKSKEVVSKFVQQKTQQDKVDNMRQRQTNYMAKRRNAEKRGDFYA